MNYGQVHERKARAVARSIMLNNPERYFYVIVGTHVDEELWSAWMKDNTINGRVMSVARAASGWSNNSPNSALVTTFTVTNRRVAFQLEHRLRNEDALVHVTRPPEARSNPVRVLRIGLAMVLLTVLLFLQVTPEQFAVATAMALILIMTGPLYVNYMLWRINRRTEKATLPHDKRF